MCSGPGRGATLHGERRNRHQKPTYVCMSDNLDLVAPKSLVPITKSEYSTDVYLIYQYLHTLTVSAKTYPSPWRQTVLFSCLYSVWLQPPHGKSHPTSLSVRVYRSTGPTQAHSSSTNPQFRLQEFLGKSSELTFKKKSIPLVSGQPSPQSLPSTPQRNRTRRNDGDQPGRSTGHLRGIGRPRARIRRCRDRNP